MLVMFSLIFVADTKITFAYNLGPPLADKICCKCSFCLHIYQFKFSILNSDKKMKVLSLRFEACGVT